MIVFPNCKINLGLHILQKRPDGYHDIETFFYPVPVTDVLEIIPTTNPADSSIQFTTSGIHVPGNSDTNLCAKAYTLLKNDFPELPPVLIHLHKVIPLGAGLGGGSSDAAFTLQLLNKIAALDLSQEMLLKYALALGSDCPFFILNKPCYAIGQGEKLLPSPIDLSGYKIMIVNPGIHVDTGKAFSSIQPATPDISIKEIINKPVSYWKDNLINDFEKVVFNSFEEIAAIKNKLYDLGAVYASMSGSGSTVYGIFENDTTINFTFPTHYFVRTSIS